MSENNEPTIKLNLDKFENIYPNCCIQWFPGTCEPGYDDNPALTANWNQIPDHIFDKLESAGYNCEWLDEWISCDECQKIFRTNPNSYGWSMYGKIFDGGFALCGNCIKEDPQNYLDELENNPRLCVTFDIDLKGNGYELLESGFESGLHPGQDDNPEKILSQLLENDKNGVYIFKLDSSGQFDINFSVYRKVENS